MPTSGNVTSVGSLIDNTALFSVPDFQRNYAWDDSNIDHFIGDIRIALQSEKTHFLGAAILLRESPPNDPAARFAIIDGQQRLTTLFMYMAILRDEADGLETRVISPVSIEGSPIDLPSEINRSLFSNPAQGNQRFESNRILRKMFRDQIIRFPSKERKPLPEKDKAQTLPLRKAHKRLRAAVIEDTAGLSEADRAKKLYQLFNAVTKQFTLLTVETANLPESFDVFMTLNSRGKSLGPSDLVKSLLMKEIIAVTEEDAILDQAEEIAVTWDQILDHLQDGDIDQFLRYFLLSWQDNKVSERHIYNTFMALLPQASDLRADYARKLLELINEKSKLYATFLRPTVLPGARGWDAALPKVCKILNPIQDSYRIVMLGLTDPHSMLDDKQKKELAYLIETYTVRSRLLAENAQKMEDFYQSLIKVLRDEGELGFTKCRANLIAKIVPDEAILPLFKSEPNSIAIARVILVRINEILDKAKEVLNLSPDRAHMEHIAPKSPTKEWLKIIAPGGADESERKSRYDYSVNSWGNLTVLEKEINMNIKQLPFDIKKEGRVDFPGYRESKVVVTRDLANVQTWTPREIRSRSEWIARNACLIWAVEPRIAEVVPYTNWLEQTAHSSSTQEN